MKNLFQIGIIEKNQVELVEKSKKMFSNLRRKNVILENKNNCFRSNFEKATNLDKLYLVPKIHKVFARYLDDQSFPTVEPLLKKYQNSWITIYSLYKERLT